MNCKVKVEKISINSLFEKFLNFLFCKNFKNSALKNILNGK